MKHIIIALGFVVFAAAGCVEPETPDTTTERVIAGAELSKYFPPDMDVVVVDQARDAIRANVQPHHMRSSLGFDGLSVGDLGATYPPAGPCACQSSSCFDNWLSENLGCNVCAVFICDGTDHIHACNVCE